MTRSPLAVAETERIADLLADITGQPRPRPVAPPRSNGPAKDVAATLAGRPSVRQLLERANWRNEPPASEAKATPPPKPAVAAAKADPGPLPAPFGVLPVAVLFGLMNWRNRPDEARPLPLIQPPPPPGSEFTVAAVISSFGWE
jgi:hypothetical protein